MLLVSTYYWVVITHHIARRTGLHLELLSGYQFLCVQSPFSLQALGNRSEDYTEFHGNYKRVSHICFSLQQYLEL